MGHVTQVVAIKTNTSDTGSRQTETLITEQVTQK